MAKFKAKAGFKGLENKFFGIHKINNLENGGTIEITDPSSLPKKVLEQLESVEAPQSKKKKEGDK